MARTEMIQQLLQRRGQRGFTIFELMIVISIMLILMAVSVPIYRSYVTRAKETVLRDNLFKMRDAIDKYTNDKNAAPATLQDLVKANYFRAIPVDPITGSNETWQVKIEDVATDRNGQRGIRDVFSGAPGTASDGSKFSDW